MPDKPELTRSTARWMWVGVVFMGLFVAAFPVYRLAEPTQRAEAREELEGFLADTGSELFATQCSTCHGVEGRGGIGPALGAREFLESVHDDQIAQLIALGVPGTEMVAYSIDHGGPMTSEEIVALTTYLRSLEEEAASIPNWRTPLSDEDLTGQDLYTMACARCHGVDRAGIEDLGPDLGPASFALEETDEWLAERITQGKDVMPRFGGVLTPDQVTLIIGFLRGVTPGEVGTTTTIPDATGSTTTSTSVPEGGDAEVLAQGKEIFDVTAGGRGCADCHGLDAAGTSDGPNIIGSSKSAINGALSGGVPDMENFGLTFDQIEAVYQYLRSLSN
jgi:mono/diheme cytochrome c family protein